MNITVRVLLGYFVIVGVAAWFVLNTFMGEVKPGVRQAMEATLVDTANVLARLAAADLASGHIADGAFATGLRDIEKRPLDAKIWDVTKTRIDYRIHVTDAHGVVVFDSAGLDEGRDFSRWHDVYLTLRGQYGARSTRTIPGDDTTSVMHVAAPIRADGKLIGVLSVAKPNRSVEPFIARGQRKILRAGLWLLGVSLLVGVLFALWIRGSIDKLLRYAERVSRGERAEPPKLDGELATLSGALATMRERLEGKQYVERYVHTLTHEMKSPLTAIRGAAELLAEDVPIEQRARFAGNIADEAARLAALVDRMLGLASVESKQRLRDTTDVALHALVLELAERREPVLTARGVSVGIVAQQPCVVRGDRFLLGQAIGNLLDNAADFSPSGETVDVTLAADDAGVAVTIADRGEGIADFAADRVFERFYSLPRPATGRKSTGLGLTFVREVADLHHGAITLQNRPDGGAIATLTLPTAQPAT